MIGIIAELIISWFLLWIIDGKNLSVLGFKLYRKRIHQLGAGFLLAVICCSLYHLMSVNFTDNSWILNKKVAGYVVLISLWFTVKSVLFEELIFRGALLYLAIEKLGIKIACILSAVSFGIYHWFSYNAFGNLFQMGIIFSMTAIFGWILAYAFAKTGSLYLPIGLHLGWNLINIVIFSNGPLGDQILVKANENKLEGLLSLFVFIFQILALPVLTYWYLRYIKPKTKNITS